MLVMEIETLLTTVPSLVPFLYDTTGIWQGDATDAFILAKMMQFKAEKDPYYYAEHDVQTPRRGARR
jgi:hypothetical protein